ncbi:transposase [Acidithiobacillus thiooxidans]|uniref:RNA-guided endonuclease InsQ/TnpB family protein n=1 Tax=Acidithiobacillus thiooxidans TaxID=930 RepID=UPI001C079C90|nr:RNA-guided endonuclease TnpB family protein [Acidithiobacillus thiooxidans]MBU2750160.1 transposase [Acidithiobacillus thiooxidans]
MDELPITQALTCKLKLLLTKEQAEVVRSTALAYRAALNHASVVAFANGKMSQGMKLQTLVYQDLREKFGLPSQMACNAPRQVAAAYKTLWERAKSNAANKTKGGTKRRYKGLDKAPKFTAMTVTLNHRRDWALGKEQTVSIGTLQGRIRCRYEGWSRHLEWLEYTLAHGITLGAAKLWQDPGTKAWYLLVSVEKALDSKAMDSITTVKGVDLNRRNIAVESSTRGKCRFYPGGHQRHLAERAASTRSALQTKGTRGANAVLRKLALRERRLNADTAHYVSKAIAEPHAMVGLEWLKDIRDRTERRHSKKTSVKRRKANRRVSSWSFAEVQAKTAYKTRLSGGVPIWVDADYTSQTCPICGHIGRENRPNNGLLFICAKCGHTLHADLVASRNISMRTLLVRQVWARTGRLSAVPEASGNETKAADLQRYAELRWSLSASSVL